MRDSSRDERVTELKDNFLGRYRASGVAPLLEEMLGTFVANLAYRQTEGEDYRVLGVEPGDPIELIDKVWRAKALFWHPDNPKTGNLERYERVAAAHARIIGQD